VSVMQMGADEKLSHVCYHVAPVLKVPTVFASVEFPRGSPPDEIVIDGHRYVIQKPLEGSSEDGPVC